MPSSAPRNLGRSHGLTQLWVLRKDPKTGAVDKKSLQQIKFKEELYEVASEDSLSWVKIY